MDQNIHWHFNYPADQIKAFTDEQNTKLLARIEAIAKLEITKATFENTFLEMEAALTEHSNTLGPVMFLNDVSPDAKVREVASQCSEELGQLYVTIFAREDLYLRLKAAWEKKPAVAVSAQRLAEEYLKDFQRNGLELAPDKRKRFVEIKKELVTLSEAYQKRIRDTANSFVLVSEAELAGFPEGARAALKKSPDGQFQVSLDRATYPVFMETAKSSAARKRVELAYNQLGGPENIALLERAVKLRSESAKLLGFPTHAAFVIDRNMAKKPESVLTFLKRLVPPLQELGKKDLAALRELKQQREPQDPEVHSWDWRYYANELKKEKYQVDNQKIKEYFTVDNVLKGMFDTYQTLLNVKFTEVPNPPTWHTSIKLYRVESEKGLNGYFYLDLYPREGKYSHFAAFSILKSFKRTDGGYQFPVSAIVGNFTPPTDTRPSLLEHDEVETMFHEFGHIMHQVLTRADFATLAGTSVKTDFVEAPSQMFENWIWDPSILAKISGHYQRPNEKLPAEMVERMLKAKYFLSGLTYLRQAAFALIDMDYHTQANIDGKSTKVYHQIMDATMMFPLQKEVYPQANFGHLMGGYDAGYYSYLWSKVFAEDMFTRFQREGLANSAVGTEYRKTILEVGGVPDPAVQIQSFLGRAPNETAFFKSLGLAPSSQPQVVHKN